MSETPKTTPTASNDHIAYSIVIILLVVIAILAYFLGASKNQENTFSGNNSVENEKTSLSFTHTGTSNSLEESEAMGKPGAHIKLTFIDDLSCEQTGECDIVANYQESFDEMYSFVWASYDFLDAHDASTKELMQKAWIREVPVILFNTNDIRSTQIKKNLTPTQDGNFYLQDPQWKTKDMFIPISERWFKLLEDEQYTTLTNTLNLYNNPKGEILWIEYSDLNCGFCKKLHNDGTQEELFEIFGKKLSYAYTYFPIFNQNAPQAFECILEQTDIDTWYNVIKKSYQNSFTEVEQIASLIPSLDKTKFDTCVQEGKYTQKITTQSQNGGMYGQGIFRVTGTPGNVLINTKTKEYIFLSGAQPITAFEATITELLGTN